MSTPPPLRVGILGTALISQKTVRAIKLTKTLTAACVASRDAERAQAFAKEFGVDRSCDSYEALVADKDVDAIYVPLPTALHHEWVQKCIAAGKHILVEKPVACSAAELDEWLRQCRAAKVMFMDGVMYMHHVRLHLMRDVLDVGEIGAAGARHVMSAFTFRGDKPFHATNIRVKKDADPLGCLGDLGWYNIRFSLWAMKYELPVEAKGVMGAATAEGVPLTFSGSLFWAEDKHTSQPPEDLAVGAPRSASFFCSFLHNWQQWAKVSGDTGTLELDDFMLPDSEEETTFAIRQDQPHSSWTKIDKKVTRHDVPACVQEAQMWENFAELVAGKGDPAFWMRVAMATQLCIDALLESAQNGGVAVKVDPKGLLAAYAK